MATQPTQSVVSLPLAPSIRRALLCAGLSSMMDIRGLSEADLMQVAGLPQELASEVLQLALGQPQPGWRLAGAVTAAELLSADSSRGGQPKGISTGCTGLDALLGGAGVACGTVTEFYGVPGVGKTQIGMQLAVNVQLPKALGGLGAQALYIDTEGSFMTDRLIDLAAAAVERVQKASASNPVQQTSAAAQAAPPLTVDSILSGILYMRVQHYTEQLALVAVLDMLLQQQPQVALVVLDSATFHFRQDFTDAAQRSRLMLSMAQQLAQLAEQRGVAVVMVNQVVTRVTDAGPTAAAGTGFSGAAAGGGNTASSTGLLAPALGEGWGQAASCRVALFWEGPQRYAMVTKAKHVPAAAGEHVPPGSMCVPYHVGTAGIC